MLYQRKLEQSEIQIALSKIWTWAADFISYDANYNTKYVYMCACM